MAVILSEEEKQQQQPAQAAPSAQAIGAGAAAPKKSQGSGLFTNLNRYIDANKGNQAVSGAVNEISGKADAAQAEHDAAVGGLNAIQAPTDTLGAKRAGVDSWLNNAKASDNQYFSAYDEAKKAYDANPNDITSQNQFMAKQQYDMNRASLKNQAEDQRNSIQGWQYQGPTSDQVNNSFGRISNTINGAKSAQGLVGNADVRAQHLKEKYNAGRGDYSAGQGRLDNFLVNNAGRDTFNAKKQALQGVIDSDATHRAKAAQLNSSIDDRANKVNTDKQDYFGRLSNFVTW